ncbi:hypothetical protein C8Q72DRAFT_769853, partial [Fomitopsis betulina]
DASTPTPEEPIKVGCKRPCIDMATNAGQHKHGKSMFTLALGTLTRVKNEDPACNQSDAAKKRQEIEQRLQEKLRKETDSVRRAEEAKKDKMAANRKEEELQLKDSIVHTESKNLATATMCASRAPALAGPPHSQARRTRRPAALAGPPHSHPPLLYYLPAILMPAQEAFLKWRTEQVKAAVDTEWTVFAAERSTGIAEISCLQQHIAEEGARTKGVCVYTPTPEVEHRQRDLLWVVCLAWAASG